MSGAGGAGRPAVAEGAVTITSLSEWVVRQAQTRPDATAVVLEQDRLTYGQLDDLSNRLARMLGQAGCRRRGDRVCVLVPKSPAAIVAIVAALKADAVYVPLDTTSPPARLAQMIASCEPRCILAASATAPLLEELTRTGAVAPSITVGWMDAASRSGPGPEFSAADWRAQSGAPRPSQSCFQDLAYILFTSGSTGIPKGVAITHANVIHFVQWAVRYFEMKHDDRVSCHSPLHFDLSAFDMFGTFAAGGELHLVPPELNLLPNKLADFIRGSALTQWFSVPSALTYMAKFDTVGVDDFPALKRILWCGEVLPTPTLAYWMRRLPGVRFTNLYGPTEATIASSYYTVPRCPEDEHTPIPIGTGCDGEELLVLDAALRPTPPTVAGDLYIRGVGLSPGYWRDPGKTQDVFLRNPLGTDPSDRIYRTGDRALVGEDGLVYFLGRMDSQIKSRGYRIELGEIEARLHALPVLRECAVVAVTSDAFEGATICCAYVPAEDNGITPATLRKELKQVLPLYMLPSRWMERTALPRNGNGKIDRSRLSEEFGRQWS